MRVTFLIVAVLLCATSISALRTVRTGLQVKATTMMAATAEGPCDAKPCCSGQQCPHRGGVCCGGNTCCPSGSTCLPSSGGVQMCQAAPVSSSGLSKRSTSLQAAKKALKKKLIKSGILKKGAGKSGRRTLKAALGKRASRKLAQSKALSAVVRKAGKLGLSGKSKKALTAAVARKLGVSKSQVKALTRNMNLKKVANSIKKSKLASRKRKSAHPKGKLLAALKKVVSKVAPKGQSLTAAVMEELLATLKKLRRLLNKLSGLKASAVGRRSTAAIHAVAKATAQSRATGTSLTAELAKAIKAQKKANQERKKAKKIAKARRALSSPLKAIPKKLRSRWLRKRLRRLLNRLRASGASAATINRKLKQLKREAKRRKKQARRALRNLLTHPPSRAATYKLLRSGMSSKSPLPRAAVARVQRKIAELKASNPNIKPADIKQIVHQTRRRLAKRAARRRRFRRLRRQNRQAAARRIARTSRKVQALVASGKPFYEIAKELLSKQLGYSGSTLENAIDTVQKSAARDGLPAPTVLTNFIQSEIAKRAKLRKAATAINTRINTGGEPDDVVYSVSLASLNKKLGLDCAAKITAKDRRRIKRHVRRLLRKRRSPLAVKRRVVARWRRRLEQRCAMIESVAAAKREGRSPLKAAVAAAHASGATNGLPQSALKQMKQAMIVAAQSGGPAAIVKSVERVKKSLARARRRIRRRGKVIARVCREAGAGFNLNACRRLVKRALQAIIRFRKPTVKRARISKRVLALVVKAVQEALRNGTPKVTVVLTDEANKIIASKKSKWAAKRAFQANLQEAIRKGEVGKEDLKQATQKMLTQYTGSPVTGKAASSMAAKVARVIAAGGNPAKDESVQGALQAAVTKAKRRKRRIRRLRKALAGDADPITVAKLLVHTKKCKPRISFKVASRVHRAFMRCMKRTDGNIRKCLRIRAVRRLRRKFARKCAWHKSARRRLQDAVAQGPSAVRSALKESFALLSAARASELVVVPRARTAASSACVPPAAAARATAPSSRCRSLLRRSVAVVVVVVAARSERSRAAG